MTIISGWWFETFFMFPYIGNVIIPTDELIFFQRGRLNHQPDQIHQVYAGPGWCDVESSTGQDGGAQQWWSILEAIIVY